MLRTLKRATLAPAMADAASRAAPCTLVHLRRMSKPSQQPKADSRDAYQVLGISGSADGSDLKEAYRRLAREHHPDRHQGEGRAAAELRFQEISQAYQLLSDTEERKRYDRALDDAKTAAARAAAAQKFRAQSWNTKVPDVQARLRNAKKEEPGFSPHALAGILVLVTANFVFAMKFLAG